MSEASTLNQNWRVLHTLN